MVTTELKKVPAEPYCKKQNCREFTRCCDTNQYNSHSYKQQGHEKVIPEQINVYTRPSFYTTTGIVVFDMQEEDVQEKLLKTNFNVMCHSVCVCVCGAPRATPLRKRK